MLRWVEKEWDNMKTLEGGWRNLPKRKLAYNIAFCAEAKEEFLRQWKKPFEGNFVDMVKVMTREYNPGSLETFLQCTPLCSVWKTSL